MKRLSLRSAFMLLLTAVFILGLVVFCAVYFINSEQWVMHPANSHIYTNGEFTGGGMITDTNGIILSQTKDGKRAFNSDSAIRRSTLHAIGDSQGFISTGIQTEFRDVLSGYDILTGLFPKNKSYNNVSLTIDANVSATALNALGGYSGTVGLYDYKTGEVLCMVSSPTYDPNSQSDFENAVNGKYEGVFLNRFLSSTYAPGSTFKIITAAAAIDNLDDAYERTYRCEGRCILGGEEVKCTGYHGDISLEKAFAVSCNCYFSSLAVDLGKSTMTKYAKKFGFGEDYYLDGIKAATSSYDVKDARTIELGWSGIGQYTDLQNPLQYLTSIGAIANGGTPIEPHVIKRITTPSGKTSKKGRATRGKKVCGGDTAQKLSELMAGATEITYGGKEFFSGLDVRGKTGTAEWGNEKTIPHAEFVGFVEDEDYPFAFIVVVEKGGSGNYIAKSIANKVLQAARASYNRK